MEGEEVSSLPGSGMVEGPEEGPCSQVEKKRVYSKRSYPPKRVRRRLMCSVCHSIIVETGKVRHSQRFDHTLVGQTLFILNINPFDFNRFG